ncbi:MAG: methyltransferase domain-containing protein [Lachnospiraceae bacterium]|nr:methyltransferase domain-containing protein [Lachnospiraceae bacterium]
MNETQYYETVYSRFWVNQTRKYGYGIYEKNLVRLVLKSSPERVFEVGIGTGWPIGCAVKKGKEGIVLDGCDISESAVVLARKELDNEEGIWAGDVLSYKGSTLYDVTYCVRASWCISNFYQTVKKMISMTKPGGYIVFDVMDRNSLYCLKARISELKEQYCRFLGIEMDERFGNHYVSIPEMKRFLRANGLSYQCQREREIIHTKDRNHTPKVVFYCRKEK